MAETMTDKAKDYASQTMTTVADSTAEAASFAAARVDEMSSDLNRSIRKSLDEQPVATLAVAAGLGFVLGALWKR